MRLTVGVCTYNPNDSALARALDAIVEQIVTEPSTELIVVDNNSDPPLHDRGLLALYPLKLLREPTPGLTAAREKVIEHAEGDVIVFVDDDNILGASYLRTVCRAFEDDQRLGLLGGAVIPEFEFPAPSWLVHFEGYIAIRRYPPDLRVTVSEPGWSEYFPIGAGMSVRRDLAEAYIADCRATSHIQGRRGSALSSGEDLDLGMFILNRGYTLVVDGSLRLTHLIGATRTEGSYIERLAVANVRSSWELEQKWAPRLGQPVFAMFTASWMRLLAAFTVLAVLSSLSPRYRIKRRVYEALIRVRLGRPL
jgi:glycosyltransferase involved in cell wall biosynthesis